LTIEEPLLRLVAGLRFPPAWEPETVDWLVISVALSVVVTVLLNVGLRMFPHAGDRAARSLAERMTATPDDRWSGDRRVKVFFPWRAMLFGSLVVTILLNLVLWIL
jgi:hypothetical protein